MQAKQKKSRKNMIMLITAVVLIAVIGVANFYVERYRDLLDVYFSTSDYQVTLSEKEVCRHHVRDFHPAVYLYLCCKRHWQV